jgi:hypothetical protein
MFILSNKHIIEEIMLSHYIKLTYTFRNAGNKEIRLVITRQTYSVLL